MPSHPTAILYQTNRALKSSAHSLILMIALFVKPKQHARDVPQFGVLSQWLLADLNKRKEFRKCTKSKTLKREAFLFARVAWRFLCLEGLERNFSKWKPSLGQLFLFGDSFQSHGYLREPLCFLTSLHCETFPSICHFLWGK